MILLRIGCLLLATAVVAGRVVVAQNDSDGYTPSAADIQEIHSCVLTMDKVERMVAASQELLKIKDREAVAANINAPKSLDAKVQGFEKYAEAVAAVKQHGFTPREYLDCLMTTMQAEQYVADNKQRHVTSYPPEELQVISKANLDFTEQHWAEIEKLTGNDSE
jgi:hypothetical protein